MIIWQPLQYLLKKRVLNNNFSMESGVLTSGLDIVSYEFSVNFDNPTKRKYDAERYQMFLWIFDKKNSRKCQKSPFFGAKCANLITIFGDSTRNQKSAVFCSGQNYQIAALPDMNVFCQILAIFGFFSNFLQKMCRFLSGNVVGHTYVS